MYIYICMCVCVCVCVICIYIHMLQGGRGALDNIDGIYISDI